MAVALGELPADTVIRSARILDVFTARFLDRHDLAIANGRVAFLGPDTSHAIGPETTVVDAEGQTLCPASSTDILIPSPSATRLKNSSSTSCLVAPQPSSPSLPSSASPRLRRDSCRPRRSIRPAPAPLRDDPTPGCSATALEEAIAPTLEQYRELLSHPRALGLGELYWPPVLRGDDRLLSLVEIARDLGKSVEGHGAGARGARLQAYAVAGVTSDHEPILATEGIERLQLGLTFLSRDGEIRQDFEELAQVWSQVPDLRRVALVTDTVGPEQDPRPRLPRLQRPASNRLGPGPCPRRPAGHTQPGGALQG